MAKLRAAWSGSRIVFRIALVLCLLWVGLHTVAYAYFAVSPDPALRAVGIGADYDFYSTTGKLLDQRGAIYDLVSNPFPAFTFKYHPAFALVFSRLNRLPVEAVKVVWYLLLTLGYLGAVLVWFLLFSRMRSFNWETVGLAVLIPLLAYDWLGTLTFGNVSPFLLLFNALLMLSLIDRRPVWAGFFTAILLMLKFYWCFPLIVLVIFREWRFLVRVLGVAVLSYAGITLVYLLAIGDYAYGLSTLRDYAVYLAIASARQPWRGTEALFDTGNNAIYQTIVRYFGFTGWASGITFGLQLVLVGFMLWQVWKLWRAGISRVVHPELSLVAAGALYIVLMCTLVEVNDGMLSGILCVLLWSMPPSRPWAMLYVPLALVEIPSLVGAAAGINWLVLPIGFPLILIGFVLLLVGMGRMMLTLPARTVATEARFSGGRF